MNETAISACGLTKAFGGRTVVSGLSFEVQKGEVFPEWFQIPVAKRMTVSPGELPENE